jgi:hypothetical protein
LLQAAKCFQDVVRQRFKEGVGDSEFTPGYADPRFANCLPRKSPEFRYRLISVAYHGRFAWFQFRQATRQMGFRVVNVRLFHNYIVSYEVAGKKHAVRRYAI